MSTENWLELEYVALRAEILALAAAEQSAVKFFLPTAGAVLTVPYLVKVTGQPYLWAICAGVAGLLVASMVHTLHASVDGCRKIGMYIKEGIEPRTEGALRWEHVIFNWDQNRSSAWLSETLAISLGAVIANVSATVGAAIAFLPPSSRVVPIVVAGVVAALSLRPLIRIANAGKHRTKYSTDVIAFLKEHKAAATAEASVEPLL
jgi:hypothetical protein